MSQVVAIVPAAGAGKRFGANKTFAYLKGKPVIVWTLQTLQDVEDIVEIIPVMRNEEIEKGMEVVEKYGITKVKKIAPGGKERQDSIYNGLMSIDKHASIVLIHDGVRPLATPGLVQRAIKSLQDCDGVIVGITVRDTIKEVKGGVVKETLKRDNLITVQTPQVFNYKIIFNAYRTVIESDMIFTDDSAIVENHGGRVKVIKGDYRNIKITTPEDIFIAETFI